MCISGLSSFRTTKSGIPSKSKKSYKDFGSRISFPHSRRGVSGGFARQFREISPINPLLESAWEKSTRLSVSRKQNGPAIALEFKQPLHSRQHQRKCEAESAAERLRGTTWLPSRRVKRSS